MKLYYVDSCGREDKVAWTLQGRVTYSLVPCIRDGQLIVCIFLNFETVSFDLLGYFHAVTLISAVMNV